MSHDGTYKVGTDIVAGTYASAGPVEGDKCYWKRIGGPDGATTLDNALSGKPQVVQIDPTDTAFQGPADANPGRSPTRHLRPTLRRGCRACSCATTSTSSTVCPARPQRHAPDLLAPTWP